MTVDVVVLGKHVEVPGSIREHTVAKLQRVEKFGLDVRRIDVDYSEPHNRSRSQMHCEILVHLKKHLVKGCATSSDQWKALDAAFTRVEEQLRRLHERRTSRRSGGARRNNSGSINGNNGTGNAVLAGDLIASDVDDDPEAFEVRRVVKAKQFEVKPMPVEEAALQMELLGHDFYFFSNAETGQAGVVYRRDQGDVGLIDAEQ